MRYLLVFLGMIISLLGCSNHLPTETEALQFTDSTGKTFTFKTLPTRIISISPAETECLFALGVGEKLIGVSDYDDYPEQAQKKPKMGGILKPDIEKIIAAKPDLILTGVSMDQTMINYLRRINLPVFKLETKTIEQIFEKIALLGKITGQHEAASNLLARLKKEHANIKIRGSRVLKKKVYLELSIPGWTVGSGEFLDEMITDVGGINIASGKKGWLQISEEKILKEDPEIIFYADDALTARSLKERKGWGHISAIRNGQVFGLNANLISRPGPRILEGMHLIAQYFHINNGDKDS